ncbi:hypothetical protein OXX79_013532, partial [Metschnikowia pulcherrima]
AKPVKTEDGGIGYTITREEGKTELVTVEEATTRHFRQLKRAAEDYLGKDVVRAVLTVPTDFSEHQRQVLKKAVLAAGLEVVQEIQEPSAALLAHDKIYVVADFGGIRSDAAVIAVRGGIMTVLATAHAHKLGGDDLDAAISEYFAKEFEKKFKANPRNNARSMAKLKAESIVTKKTLSNVSMRFELAARKPLSDMTAFIETVLSKAGLDALDIDEVLLAGGCANVVKLAQNVQFVFPESTTVVAPALDPRATTPEELSTRGAALQAALIEGFDAEEIAESLQPVVVNTQHL